MKKLLIASTNQGKIREIKNSYRDLDIEIIGLDSFPELDEVIEDGTTFAENALKKARSRAEDTGLLTLADDSGLVVEYLNGEPGIYSARYAGPKAADEDNNRKLLQELEGVPSKKRQAYFKCVAALVSPDCDGEYTTTGICEGLIAEKPEGEEGFGYDPVFYVPEYDKTMAQLPLAVKNKISHRAKAIEKMKNILEKLI